METKHTPEPWHYMQQVTEQRDELLAALIQLLDTIPGDAIGKQAAREVIAKAKGWASHD